MVSVLADAALKTKPPPRVGVGKAVVKKVMDGAADTSQMTNEYVVVFQSIDARADGVRRLGLIMSFAAESFDGNVTNDKVAPFINSSYPGSAFAMYGSDLDAAKAATQNGGFAH